MSYQERTYHALKAMDAELPTDVDELHTVALRAICGGGLPVHLTPYGAIRSIAAFALGLTDDAFYHDGEVILRACIADGKLA